MTEPTLSPWPAPAIPKVPLSAALLTAPPCPAIETEAVEPRRGLGMLVSTARRLSSRSERAQRAALKEEQRISNELADLPAGWFVQHLPVIEGFDVYDYHVDYLVIGPGGVFMLHLEHHLAAKVWVSEHKVTINGRGSDRLGQARFAARRSSTLLTEACGFDVIVQSVLVLIGASTMQLLSRPPEVHVRDQHDIHDWLCKQPPRLDVDTASAIYRQAGGAERSPTGSPAGLVE